MGIKLELIKIVEHPTDRNNWIAVADDPILKSQFSKLISYYDFIDYEGDVLYYNIISSQVDGVKQSFFDVYK